MRMRFLVISADSRPRRTSRRSVFMLTGITSWMIGSTKAPPFSKTRWPPKPVRTKEISFDERRYSQFISQTPIATRIAATMITKMIVPIVEPDMFSPSPAFFGRSPDLSAQDRFDLSRLLGQGVLGRQPFHARGAIEAVAIRAVLQDVVGVLRHRDRPAM